MNLGALLHLVGKLDAAEKVYLQALRLEPGNHVTEENLAKLRSLLAKKRVKKPSWGAKGEPKGARVFRLVIVSRTKNETNGAGIFRSFLPWAEANIASLLKPWPNGLASRPKFAKPELAYGLAKGGQTTRKSACKSQKNVHFTHIIG